MLALSAPGAGAATAEQISDRLCSRFEGAFRWSVPEASDQIVELRVRETWVDAAGRAIATGAVNYKRYDAFGGLQWSGTAQFRLEIDPESLSVAMFETDPNRADYVADGSYTGAISPDLLEIDAEWRTNGTGARGRMVIGADAACRGMV